MAPSDASRLSAVDLDVPVRRRPVLAGVSLSVAAGDLVAAYGDPGHGHTLLALCLAGRLVPDRGQVDLDGHTRPRALQEAVALVDVPGVSEPDDAVPATTIVGEELAMARRRAGRRHVQAWLTEEGLESVAGRTMIELGAVERVTMLVRLAALRGPTFLVLTLPERHGGDPRAWLPVLRAEADRGLGVLLTVGTTTAAHLRATTDLPAVGFGVDPDEQEQSA